MRKEDSSGRFRTLYTRYDSCEKNNAVIFRVTGGDLTVLPGETKYFHVPSRDGFGISGGFYWICGKKNKQTKIEGASYIRVNRNAETGIIRIDRIAPTY
jgi:hypothetical protein